MAPDLMYLLQTWVLVKDDVMDCGRISRGFIHLILMRGCVTGKPVHFGGVEGEWRQQGVECNLDFASSSEIQADVKDAGLEGRLEGNRLLFKA